MLFSILYFIFTSILRNFKENSDKNKKLKISKMQDDESMIESMQLALQTQEEIRQDLLKEISALESNTQGPKLTEKSMEFYKSSLARVLSEKKSLTDQIEKFKITILPEIQRQFDRIHQKREAMEFHISALQKYRNMTLFENVKNPDKRTDAVKTFIENLTKEIDDLTNKENDLQEKIRKARTELHVLQEQYLSSQRESAKKIWESELANESGLNKTRKLNRRMSHTVVSKKSVLRTPPNLMKKHNGALKKPCYADF
ncbi:hypothetical protein TRFO_33696 [Tritrichomonas foetus]|uniref:Uncharacterized protein n=1 Tax=Tritrichomonas foetus TaxID=1144522 RepID=A0A1J4JL14_9EUKA|nr:hypothetical protein TRFO_33696 [Tritrichomonas foetus]|eukprot:OHS99778.1 hypothetical protein TRFO_33696 [Tritrichomonas foetus]